MVFDCISKNFPKNIFWCLEKKKENTNQKMQNNTNQKNTSHKSRKTQIQNNTSKLRLVYSNIFTENASNQAKETKTQQKKCNQLFDRADERCASDERARPASADERCVSNERDLIYRAALVDRAAQSTTSQRDFIDRATRSTIASRDLVDRAARRRGAIVGRAARSGLSLLSLSLIWALSSLSLSLSFSGSYLK